MDLKKTLEETLNANTKLTYENKLIHDVITETVNNLEEKTHEAYTLQELQYLYC